MKIFLEHFCFVRIQIIGIIILLWSSSGCSCEHIIHHHHHIFVGEVEYIISMVQFHNSRVKGQGLKSRKTLDTIPEMFELLAFGKVNKIGELKPQAFQIQSTQQI